MDDYIDSLPKYVHRPLDGPKWIRIVQLLPSDIVQAVLRCCILHLDRDTLAISIDPSSNYYSAVSYVWGAPDFSRNFMCCDDSGQGQDSLIKITSNVEIMLRRIRKRSKSLNLWVDAICLDQSNQVELSQQVPLMGEIYHQSYRTYIWMGK